MSRSKDEAVQRLKEILEQDRKAVRDALLAEQQQQRKAG